MSEFRVHACVSEFLDILRFVVCRGQHREQLLWVELKNRARLHAHCVCPSCLGSLLV